MLKIILLLVSFVKGFFKKFFRFSNKLVRTGGFYRNSQILNSFKNRIKNLIYSYIICINAVFQRKTIIIKEIFFN